MKRNIILLLILSLTAACLGFGVGKHIYKPANAISGIDTFYLRDTVRIEKPVPEYIYLPPLSEFIDTAAIIADYLRAKIYTDTLVSNKNITAILKDTIYQNSILGREFIYTLSTPVITTLQKPFSLFVVADTRMSTSIILTRKRWLIQGGYDFRYKYPYIGIGLKLY